jgi:tRNA A37 methylthiotransferase MiaB
MARSGDDERFAALIDRIRGLDPHAVFRSNFILGFPGETEDDVDVLERFLIDQRLDWVGLFAYSDEDGTAAEQLPDKIADEVAAERAPVGPLGGVEGAIVGTAIYSGAIDFAQAIAALSS